MKAPCSYRDIIKKYTRNSWIHGIHQNAARNVCGVTERNPRTKLHPVDRHFGNRHVFRDTHLPVSKLRTNCHPRCNSEYRQSSSNNNLPANEAALYNFAKGTFDTDIRRIKLAPAHLPAWFQILLGVRRDRGDHVHLDTVGYSLQWLRLPDPKPEDERGRLFEQCVAQTALLVPCWQQLTAEELNSFELPQQLRWMQQCLEALKVDDSYMHVSLSACQSLQRIALQLRQAAGGLTNQLHKFSHTELTDITTRWLQAILNCATDMLGSLIKTAHTSYQGSMEVYADAKTFSVNNLYTFSPPRYQYCGQSEIPTSNLTATDTLGATRSPAHTVSVQLSRTPSIGNQNLDQAKDILPETGFDNCAKEVTDPVTSTKFPLCAAVRVDNPLNSDIPTPSRLKFLRCSICLGAGGSPKITRSMSAHVGNFGAAVRSQVEIPPPNPSPYRRMNFSNHSLQSVSVPEGLNRSSYYRLAFLPPKRHSESDTLVCSVKKEVMKVKSDSENLYQHSPQSELHNTILPQPSQCRLELCKKLISEINQDLLKGALTRGHTVSTTDRRHTRELTNQLLDQTVAITFTHRMNQLSAVSTTDLSAVVTCSTLRVNELVDTFILNSFRTCKEVLHRTSIGRVPGVQRVHELAIQLVNHLCDLLGSTADTTYRTQMAQLWADRLIHLAYPASCLAMDRILDQDNKLRSPDYRLGDRSESNKPPVFSQLALPTMVPLIQSCNVVDPHLNYKALENSRSDNDVMSHMMSDIGHLKRQTLLYSPNSVVEVEGEHLAFLGVATPDELRRMGSKQYPSGKAGQTCPAAIPTDCVYLSPHSGVIGGPNSPPRSHNFSVLSCGSENGTDYADFSDSSSATYKEPESESNEFHGSLRAYHVQTLIHTPPDASKHDCRLKLILSKKGSNPVLKFDPEDKEGNSLVLCSQCSQTLLAFLNFQQLDLHSFTPVTDVAVQCNRVFSRTEIRRATEASTEIGRMTTQVRVTDALGWTTDDATRTDPPTLSRCISAVFVVPEEEPSINVSSLRRTSIERSSKLLGSQTTRAETRIDPGGDKEACNNKPADVVCQTFSAESCRLNNHLSQNTVRRHFHGCTEEGKLFTQTKKAYKPHWLNRKGQTKTGERVTKLSLKEQATAHNCDAYAIRRKEPSNGCRQAVTLSSQEKRTTKPHMTNWRQPGETKSDPATSETTKCITSRVTRSSPLESNKRRQELPALFSMDPFYSCLEELEACLQKAESRLHAVKQASDQGVNDESRYKPRRSRGLITKNVETSAIFTCSSGSRRRVNRWPSLSLLHHDPYTGHSYRNNEVRSCMQHQVTDSHIVQRNPRNMHLKLNSERRLCCTNRRSSHARWTVDEIRSRGPANFPAPSMQLPIRKSCQMSPSKESAGLSRCLLYASASSQRGHSAQNDSRNGSVCVRNKENRTPLKTAGFL